MLIISRSSYEFQKYMFRIIAFLIKIAVYTRIYKKKKNKTLGENNHLLGKKGNCVSHTNNVTEKPNDKQKMAYLLKYFKHFLKKKKSHPFLNSKAPEQNLSHTVNN